MKGDYLESMFENDKNVVKKFKKFQEEIEAIDTSKDPNGHFNYVKEELGKRAEVYTQQLRSVGMR